MAKLSKREARKRRHKRVRNKVKGTPNRPRLAVNRSLKHIYAQVIDDLSGKTVAAASTVEEEIQSELKNTGNAEAAKVVGKHLAQRALDNGVDTVVFDRAGNDYHGRIKALAEAAREGGLEF